MTSLGSYKQTLNVRFLSPKRSCADDVRLRGESGLSGVTLRMSACSQKRKFARRAGCRRANARLLDDFPASVRLAAGCSIGRLGAAVDGDGLLELPAIEAAPRGAVTHRRHGPGVAGFRVVPRDGLADRRGVGLVVFLRNG